MILHPVHVMHWGEQLQQCLLCLQPLPLQEMHNSVTWFSVVAAVSLGILVPVVVVGFFPLGTGMADSFILPKNKTSEAAL